MSTLTLTAVRRTAVTLGIFALTRGAFIHARGAPPPRVWLKAVPPRDVNIRPRDNVVTLSTGGGAPRAPQRGGRVGDPANSPRTDAATSPRVSRSASRAAASSSWRTWVHT